MPFEGRRATAATYPCCGETDGTFGGAFSPRIETVGTFVGASSLWYETAVTFVGTFSPRIETGGTFVGASSHRGATVGTSVDHKRLFWGHSSPTEVLGVSSNCLRLPTVVALVSSACR